MANPLTTLDRCITLISHNMNNLADLLLERNEDEDLLNEIVTPKYPFHRDFIELSQDVINWKKDVQERIKKAIQEKDTYKNYLFQLGSGENNEPSFRGYWKAGQGNSASMRPYFVMSECKKIMKYINEENTGQILNYDAATREFVFYDSNEVHIAKYPAQTIKIGEVSIEVYQLLNELIWTAKMDEIKIFEIEGEKFSLDEIITANTNEQTKECYITKEGINYLNALAVNETMSLGMQFVKRIQ